MECKSQTLNQLNYCVQAKHSIKEITNDLPKEIYINSNEWCLTFSTIEKFLSSTNEFDLKFLNKLNKSFNHESIDNLSNLFGYNKALLKLSSCIISLNDIKPTEFNMNSVFWCCMEFRLGQYEKLIQSFITNIDKLEQNINDKLEEANRSMLVCSRCEINQVSILYLPCGHIIICSSCFKSTSRRCESCATDIDEYHNVYL